jgi:hypothetical protein
VPSATEHIISQRREGESITKICPRVLFKKEREEEGKKHRHEFRTNLALSIGTLKLRLVKVNQFNQLLASPSFRRRKVGIANSFDIHD